MYNLFKFPFLFQFSKQEQSSHRTMLFSLKLQSAGFYEKGEPAFLTAPFFPTHGLTSDIFNVNSPPGNSSPANSYCTAMKEKARDVEKIATSGKM